MKKILAFLIVLCILMGTGLSAFAETEALIYGEAPLMAGFGTSDASVYEEASLQKSFWDSNKVDEEGAAQKILAAFDDLDRKVDISDYNIPMDDFSEFYFGLLYENPEYFYVKLSYQFSYNMFDRTVSEVTIFYLDIYQSNQYGETYDWALIEDHRTAFDAAMDTALAAVPQGLSDLETVLFIHEYLGSRIYYDYDNLQTDTLPDHVFTTYGALVDRVAVCQGYSLTLNLLCREKGIDTLYITSVVDNHGWSLIQVDGNWYHVDMTYNDPVYFSSGTRLYHSVLKHGYFLISDADLNDGKHDDFALPQDRSAPPVAAETLAGIWQDQAGQMVYHEGYWYYTDDTDIVRSRIDGSERSVVVADAGMTVRLSTDGQTLLYSNSDGVYTARFDGRGQALLYTAQDEKIRGLRYEDGWIHIEVLSEPDNAQCMHKMEFSGYIPPAQEPEEPPVVEPEVPPVEDPVEETAGDLDGDGVVMVSDILYVKSMIMRSSWTDIELGLADLDGDGTVTVGDIISMKSIIMSH